MLARSHPGEGTGGRHTANRLGGLGEEGLEGGGQEDYSGKAVRMGPLACHTLGAASQTWADLFGLCDLWSKSNL